MKRLLWLMLCLLALPVRSGDGRCGRRDADPGKGRSQSRARILRVVPQADRHPARRHATKEYVLWTVKTGADKMVALFLDPPADKGRVTLRLGENMWLYMPDVGRPIRITSLQSVTGSVFNNADILRIDYTSEYNVESCGRAEGPVSALAEGEDRRSRLRPAQDVGRQAAPASGDHRVLCRERAAAEDAALQGHQGFRRRHQAPCDARDRQPAVQGLQVGDAVVGPEEARATPTRSSRSITCRGSKSSGNESVAESVAVLAARSPRPGRRRAGGRIQLRRIAV